MIIGKGNPIGGTLMIARKRLSGVLCKVAMVFYRMKMVTRQLVDSGFRDHRGLP